MMSLARMWLETGNIVRSIYMSLCSLILGIRNLLFVIIIYNLTITVEGGQDDGVVKASFSVRCLC